MSQFNMAGVQALNMVQNSGQPTTVRGARARRLQQAGVDPAALRASVQPVLDQERLNKQKAQRAAILRTQGRYAEAEQLVNEVRSYRDNPNRSATLRKTGQRLGLLRGTVGDLSPEQQAANRTRNEASMASSQQAAYANAAADTERRRAILLGRQAGAGRAAQQLTLDDRQLNDQQAAAFFLAQPGNVQQRVTRGVPMGDGGVPAAQERETGLARVVEQGVQIGQSPRAARELNPEVIRQIRVEQELERRARQEAEAAAAAGLDIAAYRRQQAVTDAQTGSIGATTARDTAQFGQQNLADNLAADEQLSDTTRDATLIRTRRQRQEDQFGLDVGDRIRDDMLGARAAEARRQRMDAESNAGVDSTLPLAAQFGITDPKSAADLVVNTPKQLASIRGKTLTAETEKEIGTIETQIETARATMSSVDFARYASFTLRELIRNKRDTQNLESAGISIGGGQEILNTAATVGIQGMGGPVRRAQQLARTSDINNRYQRIISILKDAANGGA